MAETKQPEKKVFVRDRDIFNQRKIVNDMNKKFDLMMSSDPDIEDYEEELRQAERRLIWMIKENKKFNALFAK